MLQKESRRGELACRSKIITVFPPGAGTVADADSHGNLGGNGFEKGGLFSGPLGFPGFSVVCWCALLGWEKGLKASSLTRACGNCLSDNYTNRRVSP
jgi:hypothetical protein